MTIPHILIKKSDIFETQINKNLRCIHGYTNYVAQNELITWVSISSWKFFPSEFPQAKIIIPCPRKIIFNTCEQINVSGGILNAG